MGASVCMLCSPACCVRVVELTAEGSSSFYGFGRYNNAGVHNYNEVHKHIATARLRNLIFNSLAPTLVLS